MSIDKFDNGQMAEVDSIDAMMDTAERRKKALAMMTEMAISNTEPKHWQNFNGKPYLDGDGGARIMRTFGVSVSLKCRREDRNDEKGDYYIYIVDITATVGRESIDSIGTCSSRDKFLGQVKKDGKPTFKPLHDVVEDHIMKKAKANAYANVAKDLFGIRDLTWDRLEEMTDNKINRRQTDGVDFRGGAKGGSQGRTGDKTKQQVAKMMQLKEELGITDDNKNDFWAFFNKYNVKWKTCDGVTAGKIIKDMQAALDIKRNREEHGNPGSEEEPPWMNGDGNWGLI